MAWPVENGLVALTEAGDLYELATLISSPLQSTQRSLEGFIYAKGCFICPFVISSFSIFLVVNPAVWVIIPSSLELESRYPSDWIGECNKPKAI